MPGGAGAAVVSSSSPVLALLKRDLILGMRHRADAFNPLVFFLIVLTMFPLALGPDAATLQELAPAIVWIALMLASTLSLESMFRSDYEDGSLEQLLLTPASLPFLVLAKITAHWLLSSAPLMVFALLFAGFLYLPQAAMLPLLYTLLLGTPVLSLVGAVAVALTVGLRGGGMLLVLLILPLYLPLLIFTVAAVNNAAKGLSISAELYFIAALLVFSLTLSPALTAFAIRIRMS